jgi:hypothetical protein
MRSLDQHRLPVALLLCLLAVGGCGGLPGGQGGAVSQTVKVLRGAHGATEVVLPVTLQGQGPFTFALDTGASTSLIDLTVARQLHLQAAGAAQPISGIGGVERATPVRVTSWNAGKINLPAATIMAAPMPAQRTGGLAGLLGSDIWWRFGRFTLDYGNATITVYRQAT